MPNKIEQFNQAYLKKDSPEIQAGDVIRIYQKVKEGEKDKVQEFEGQVLARKHGKEIGASITVRKIVAGVAVEKIFPIHLPSIEKIEVLRKAKARRAKLYYLREAKGERAKIKQEEAK